MKVSKFKKVVLALGLGLGLSAGFSATVSAGVNGDICDSLRYKCSMGDENACITVARLCR